MTDHSPSEPVAPDVTGLRSMPDGPHTVHFPTLDELRRRRSVKWRAHAPDVLPSFVAEMDVDPAPAVADALAGAIAIGDTGYGYRGSLPDAFAAFATRRFGWAPSPARISLTGDIMSGIAAVLRMITEPGDPVVINPPVYGPFWDFIEHVDRRVVEVPLRAGPDGDHRLDLDGLETAFARGARAHLLCHPHNPTGSVWTRAELTELARLADAHGVRVLSDEVHAPLTLAGAHHIPFLSLPEAGAARAVAFHAASKAWNLPGLKVALTVAGPDAEPELATLPLEVQKAAGHLAILAAEAAFRDGEAWLDQLLAALDDRRDRLQRLLATHLPAVRHHPARATYLAWLDCRPLGLVDPARAFLERGRVAVGPGTSFGRQGRGFVRLSIATRPTVLAATVERMASAL
jgi:cystathionine beta-lyase